MIFHAQILALHSFHIVEIYQVTPVAAEKIPAANGGFQVAQPTPDRGMDVGPMVVHVDVTDGGQGDLLSPALGIDGQFPQVFWNVGEIPI